MASFQLELITPNRVLVSERARSVRVPGTEGSLGILAGHAPLMSALRVGLVKVELENGDQDFIATSGGFIEVTQEKVTILADTAETAKDIDVARAESAVARARQHLDSGGAVDYAEASAALERATNRLRVAQMATNGE